MVGRPRQFDMEQVLDRAMETFWANGYEATSMADLVKATGLHKGSLYSAFENKHALFVAALRHYLKNMRKFKNEALAGTRTPLEGIRAVAHGMLEMMEENPDCPKGCMAINALAEMAGQDDEIEKILDDHLTYMRSSLIDTIKSAQANGEINPDKDPEVVAMLIITFMTGIDIEMRGPMTLEQAHQLIDEQLNAITV